MFIYILTEKYFSKKRGWCKVNVRIDQELCSTYIKALRKLSMELYYYKLEKMTIIRWNNQFASENGQEHLYKATIYNPKDNVIKEYTIDRMILDHQH